MFQEVSHRHSPEEATAQSPVEAGPGWVELFTSQPIRKQRETVNQ